MLGGKRGAIISYVEVVHSKNIFDASQATIPYLTCHNRRPLVKASLLDGPFRPLFH
jgi:hypothetical protein